jgi:hypothetical protein
MKHPMPLFAVLPVDEQRRLKLLTTARATWADGYLSSQEIAQK